MPSERPRVLCVGNMYPPHHLGGYELVWRSAVHALRAAGHEVRVLTTDFRRSGVTEADDPDVHRELRWYWRDHAFLRPGPLARLAIERHNARVLERHLAEARPDVVTWWAMGGMSLSLLERVRRQGLPAVGFVHDEWPVYGPRADAWTRIFSRRPGLAVLAERLTGIPARVDLDPAARWVFVSETTRERARRAGWRLPDSGVAHSGIDPSFIDPQPPRPWRWRMLCVGRLDRRKGVDAAISALAELPPDTWLTIAGDGDSTYEGELRDLARRVGVEPRVEFAGGVPRDKLPALYADADVVIFPVRWAEPWGLVPLEAMALGRPVVASGRGGSGEYLRDGENCLIADPDDPVAIARAVRQLAEDRSLRERLRAAGLETAPLHTEDEFNRAVIREVGRAASLGSRAC